MLFQVCSICKIQKETTQFWKSSNSKSGFYWYCKPCGSVYHKRKSKEFTKRWKDSKLLDLWARNTLNRIKRKVEDKDLDFDLTQSFLIDIAPTLCPALNISLSYSGVDMDISQNNAASVDRLDPLKGYTKKNVRVISLRANRIKNSLTVSELRLLLQDMKSINVQTVSNM